MSAFGVQINRPSFDDFLQACREAPRDTKREVRKTLGAVGELVRVDAASLMLPKHRRSARGYKVRVIRDKGVRVEQSIPKTTGQHPAFGKWQMKHVLLPALAANQTEIQTLLEEATERVCRRFERGR